MKFFTSGKSNQPKSLVFLLHGWGANGQDLLPVAEMWRPAFPDTLFVCPQAPEVCDANPFGFQWFGLGDWSGAEIAAGAENAFPVLNDFIHQQMTALNVEPKKTVLMGFSQGMMMALYAGLRQETPLAGILGYSGALVGASETIPVSYPKTNICLIHGDSDPVVPVEMHDVAVKWLKDHQYSVDSLKVAGLAHGIDGMGLQKGTAFLQKVIL